MKQNSRACIAYIAACLNGASGSYVYDFFQSKYISIGGVVNSTNVNIYDYERGCYISGPPRNLYDYGNGAHIQLIMNGPQFRGYDYDTGNHYSGDISGNSISIYDYENSTYFDYRI